MEMERSVAEKPVAPVIIIKVSDPDGVRLDDLSTVLNIVNDTLAESDVERVARAFGVSALVLNPRYIDSFGGPQRSDLELSKEWAQFSSGLAQARVTSVRDGSVVIEALIVGSCAWLLLNTIGETVKDAYKKTVMHEKLTNLLLVGRSEELEFIGKTIASKSMEAKLNDLNGPSIYANFRVDDSIEDPSLHLEINLGRFDFSEDLANKRDVEIILNRLEGAITKDETD